MRLRTLAALATLGGGVLFAGWGAIGVVRSGSDEPVQPALPAIASAIETDATDAREISPLVLAASARLYDRLLLSPHMVMPPRPAAVAAIEPAPAPVEATGPVPVALAATEPVARHVERSAPVR